MDYFQGVVTEFLRASRSTFVNTECLIQLDDGDKQLRGRHWYCDAMAVNFRLSTVYLCEITYSATMQPLLSRLQSWNANWLELTGAVLRDSGVPKEWKVEPWLFIPRKHHAVFTKRSAAMKPSPEVTSQMPPRVSPIWSRQCPGNIRHGTAKRMH